MYVFRVLAIVTAVVFTVIVLAAQQPGPTTTGGAGGATTGGPTTGTGGTTNSGGSSTRGSDPNSRTSTNSPSPDMTRPIFLSGRVVLSDGTALSESVIIERVCNGAPHAEAHTDAQGRFSFQLGQSQEVFIDLSDPLSPGLRGSALGATQPGGIRGSELTNCDLRASMPGFRSDLVSLANHRYMDNPDVGTIVLHRLGKVEGLTTSAISARAPKDARKAFEKGLDAARKNKDDEAKIQFEKAVELYPQYATAWFELGKIHEKGNHVDEARRAYTQALTADPRFINPHERMYFLAFKEAKWEEVATTTDRVIHLNPYEFPSAYYFNGIANLQLNQLDAAEKSAREAVKLDTAHRNPKASYILGLVLARKRVFGESSEYLRAYLKAAPDAPDSELARRQLVQVESLAQVGAQPEAGQK